MKYLYPLIVTSVLSLVAGMNAQAEPSLDMPKITLPDLGSSANSVMTPTQEIRLGFKEIRELRGKEPIIEDPELSGWLQDLGRRLTTYAQGGSNFSFLLVKDPEINAYAMPGGVIVVNSGLFYNVSSESELAAVLSHEIAHVTQRHIARMMADQKGNALMTGLGVLAGAAAATKSSDAGEAIIASTIAASAHKQLGFSREAESEADRIGLQTLASAGFNPEAMPLFMEKLDRRSDDKLYGDISKYLSTHPLSIDRVSDTRTRAQQLARGNVREDVSFLYMREKIKALTAPNSPSQTTTNPQVQNYAQAIRALRTGNGEAALQKLNASGNDLAVTLAKAQAYNLLHQYDATEKLLLPLANSRPENEALLTTLSEALVANGKAAQAWQLMNRHHLTEISSLEFLEARQRTAEAAGQTAEAYISAAERSLRMGEYRHAQAALEQASRIPGTPAPTVARLQAMANQMQNAEKQDKQAGKL